MKKYLTSIMFLAIIIATGCKKEEVSNTDSKSKIKWYENIAARFSGLSMTSESEHIYNLMMESDLSFDFIHTNNFGVELNSKFGGILTEDASVKVNSSNFYNANLNSDSWLYVSSDLVYGQQNEITFRTSSYGDQVIDIYVPEKLSLTTLSDSGNAVNASASNVMLTWNADGNNPTGQIAIMINTYDNDMVEGSSVPTDEHLILTDDDGSFDIKEYINNSNIKFVNIIAVRGNAEVVDSNEGKIFFNFRSQDHHLYKITH